MGAGHPAPGRGVGDAHDLGERLVVAAEVVEQVDAEHPRVRHEGQVVVLLVALQVRDRAVEREDRLLGLGDVEVDVVRPHDGGVDAEGGLTGGGGQGQRRVELLRGAREVARVGVARGQQDASPPAAHGRRGVCGSCSARPASIRRAGRAPAVIMLCSSRSRAAAAPSWSPASSRRSIARSNCAERGLMLAAREQQRRVGRDQARPLGPGVRGHGVEPRRQRLGLRRGDQ